MQAIETKVKGPIRSRRSRAWIGFLSIFSLGTASAAIAQTTPGVTVSQHSLVADFSGGGFTPGGSPAGGSFAVTQAGDVAVGTTYGGSLDLVNGVSGAVTQISTPNSAGVTVDSQNNLYVSNLYGPAITKVPFVNGAYVTTAPAAMAACTGKDTAWCSISGHPGSPVKAMAFDAAGDLFMVTTTDSVNSGNAIYELTAATLYSGKAALVYTDANPVSSIALDPKGNLFYTEAVYQTGSTQLTSTSSSLNELTYTGGAYATTPIQLVNFIPTTVANYNDTLSGVAVDQNGTVYFSDQNNGTFAFPNNGTALSAGIVASSLYQVSSQGGYQVAVGGKGNVFAVAYDNAKSTPAVFRILVNKIQAGTGSSTTPGMATASVFTNGSCSTTLTFAATENGAASTEFSGSAGSNCTAQTAIGSTANTTATFTFKPTAVGERQAVVAVTASNSTAAQAITISGVGQGGLLTLDPGVATAYKTGLTTPTGVTADAAGNLFVADAGANKVFEIPVGSAATTTPTAIGSGFKMPSATAIDASGNLYIADTGNNQIIEIPNVSGTLQATSQVTLLANTATFAGTVLNAPTALAIGPDGTLYIYDSGNNRIVSYAPGGFTTVRMSGLTAAVGGMTIDSTGDLYLSVPSAGEVLVYVGGALANTLASGLVMPEGLAIDPSGSLLVADAGVPGIVLFSSAAGSLTTSAAKPAAPAIVENVTAAPGALAIDSVGNLYTTDATAAAPGVFAINRSAVAIAFGNVAPGATSPTVPIYAESAGNVAVNTPTISAAPSGAFTLTAGGTNPCGSAATLAAGSFCGFTAQFSPAASATGAQSGTATLAVTGASNVSSATITLSGSAMAAAGAELQVITFPPPASPISFTTTPITLYATTTSGLTVSFTVTSGPATVVGNQLTLTGYGNVVVTARQGGNGTYGAATPVPQTIQVNPLSTSPTATPTFSLAAGVFTFVPQSTNISDTNPAAVIYYTTDGSNPATSKTAIMYTLNPATSSVPTPTGASISITSTETISAIAITPGYANSAVATATYTINPQPAAFSLAVNPSPLSIITAQRGAIDVVVTGSNGFNSAVTFTVAGLPSGAAASFTPSTVTPTTGTPSATSVLTIVLAGAQAQLEHRSGSMVPEVFFACAFCFIGWRKRRGAMRVLLLLTAGLLSMHLLSGCGSPVTPDVVSTSTVTVTATSGSLVQTTTFPLTVTAH